MGKKYVIGVHGRISFKWVLREEDMDWVHLAQDRDQLWAFVNTVMYCDM
jgi:hypothetical protein